MDAFRKEILSYRAGLPDDVKALIHTWDAPLEVFSYQIEIHFIEHAHNVARSHARTTTHCTMHVVTGCNIPLGVAPVLCCQPVALN